MIYDYRCEKCEHTFERILKVDDMMIPTTEPCPNCGESGSIVKTITAANINGFNSFGTKKINRDFQDRLSSMKKFYKGSNINDAGL